MTAKEERGGKCGEKRSKVRREREVTWNNPLQHHDNQSPSTNFLVGLITVQ